MRICFKVHTLVSYFESSTTTEMLIRYHCCREDTGRVQKLLLLHGKNPFCADGQSVLGGGGGGTAVFLYTRFLKVIYIVKKICFHLTLLKFNKLNLKFNVNIFYKDNNKLQQIQRTIVLI